MTLSGREEMLAPFVSFFKALDNVIAEDDEFVQEDYDDVDEDLKAQILGKAASGEQEVQPTSKEEDSGMLLVQFIFHSFPTSLILI